MVIKGDRHADSVANYRIPADHWRDPRSLPGRWRWCDRPWLCDAQKASALHTLIRQRHPTPSCGGHAPTAERTMNPARMCLESLDLRPGIREQPGSLAEVSPPKRRVRSNLESRRQTAWVARPFCANNPNTVSWGGILKGLPLRGAPASGGGMPIACGVDCALSLDLFLLKRFFSLSLFLLLDEPQPRKTNGEDHHHDQNGVLNHRSDPELMLTDQRRPK